MRRQLAENMRRDLMGKGWEDRPRVEGRQPMDKVGVVVGELEDSTADRHCKHCRIRLQEAVIRVQECHLHLCAVATIVYATFSSQAADAVVG